MKIFIFMLTTLLLSRSVFAEWKIDFSRRQKDLIRRELEKRTVDEQPTIKKVFEKEQPKEELVILNTEKGFVPSTLKLRVDQLYKISVVNVNQQNKNVSFMLDAFAEHHGTYFGEIVEFTVRPKKEGLYPFFSPEIETSGNVLVFKQEKKLDEVPPIRLRQPASKEKVPEYNIIRGSNGRS